MDLKRRTGIRSSVRASRIWAERNTWWIFYFSNSGTNSNSRPLEQLTVAASISPISLALRLVYVYDLRALNYVQNLFSETYLIFQYSSPFDLENEPQQCQKKKCSMSGMLLLAVVEGIRCPVMTSWQLRFYIFGQCCFQWWTPRRRTRTIILMVAVGQAVLSSSRRRSGALFECSSR